jgi:hypothetical protein
MFRLWYIVVGVWMLYLFQQFWLYPRIMDSLGSDESVADGFDPTRLIFLISMGEQAKASKLVERFVWSARHRGKWSGYILLLTDAPLDRYKSFSHRFLVMNPEARHFNATFKDDMPYKRFKTFALDYVDKDTRLNQVELIYYLDADNIVGNSLPNMFHDLEGKYNIPSSTANPSQHGKWLRTIPRLWFFANKYTHLSVQGGQFVIDRRSSEPCLRAWRTKIDANVSEAKDQPALHKIRGNGRNQDCQIVTMLPKKHLFFPANSTIHKGTHACFAMCCLWFVLCCAVLCVSRGALHPFSRTLRSLSRPILSCTPAFPIYSRRSDQERRSDDLSDPRPHQKFLQRHRIDRRQGRRSLRPRHCSESGILQENPHQTRSVK